MKIATIALILIIYSCNQTQVESTNYIHIDDIDNKLKQTINNINSNNDLEKIVDIGLDKKLNKYFKEGAFKHFFNRIISKSIINKIDDREYHFFSDTINGYNSVSSIVFKKDKRGWILKEFSIGK